MNRKTYQAGELSFDLKLHMPIEDEFMVAVDTVNHYMVEDPAAGELYAHPLLRKAWCVRMFMQYHTDLPMDTFEMDGRKAIFALLQWVEDHDVLRMDGDIQKCFACFMDQVDAVEQTMRDRFAQRCSAGGQLRKLMNFIERTDEGGSGGWEQLRNVIAEHMLDAQETHAKSNAVDMRMFGKMKNPKPQ